MPQQYPVIISASNALCKWLRISPAAPAATADPHSGHATIATDATQIAWQCHVIHPQGWHGMATVIAVEARSRATLLLPFERPPTQDEFESALCALWADVVVSAALEHALISRDVVPRLFARFHEGIGDIQWLRNTDPAMSGNIRDAEHCIKLTLTDRSLHALDDELAVELALQLNSRMLPAASGRVIPLQHLVEDGLFRFGAGILPDAALPSPFGAQTDDSAAQLPPEPALSLQDFSARRR